VTVIEQSAVEIPDQQGREHRIILSHKIFSYCSIKKRIGKEKTAAKAAVIWFHHLQKGCSKTPVRQKYKKAFQKVKKVV
jgi:hypothetical protein